MNGDNRNSTQVVLVRYVVKQQQVSLKEKGREKSI